MRQNPSREFTTPRRPLIRERATLRGRSAINVSRASRVHFGFHRSPSVAINSREDAHHLQLQHRTTAPGNNNNNNNRRPCMELTKKRIRFCSRVFARVLQDEIALLDASPSEVHGLSSRNLNKKDGKPHYSEGFGSTFSVTWDSDQRLHGQLFGTDNRRRSCHQLYRVSFFRPTSVPPRNAGARKLGGPRLNKRISVTLEHGPVPPTLLYCITFLR